MRPVSETLVVVPFGLEELVEVRFAVDVTMQAGEVDQAKKCKEKLFQIFLILAVNIKCN